MIQEETLNLERTINIIINRNLSKWTPINQIAIALLCNSLVQ